MGFVLGSSVSLYYAPETVRGASPGDGVWRFPSDGVENFTLNLTNNAEHIHTMSYSEAQGVVEGMRENTMSFDYYLQRHGNTASVDDLPTSLEYYALQRNSVGSLTSLTFAVCPTSSTTITCNGGLIDTFSLSAAAGERIKCSVGLKFSHVSTASDAGSNTMPTLLANTWETMNRATLTRTSWFDNGVANFSMNVANNVQTLHGIGSVQPIGIVEGKQTLSGSCDVFLNSTGTYEFEEVYGATKDTLTFASGQSTTATDASMKWIFTDTIFTSIPITATTDTTALQSGLDWIAKSVAFSIYS